MGIYAGWTYPVCNVGDPVSAGNANETICNIPDNSQDKGANLGQAA